MVDILVPQVGYVERDTLVLYNVMYYLEKWGYSVKVVPHFDLHALFRHRPKHLLLTDANGDFYAVMFARYAKRLGMTTVSLSAESNHESQVLDTFWGYNTGREMNVDVRFVWNRKIKEDVLADCPDYKGLIDVSGAVGFDKYRWMKYKDKKTLLKKYGKSRFSKVITYAGWNFSYFVDEKRRKTNPFEYSEEEVERRKLDLEFVRDVLGRALADNPDILFIFKKHPGLLPGVLEILDEWSELDNAIVMQYEENIYDLINVSDIWLVYDSITSVESWILGKPVIQVVPEAEDYSRWYSRMHEGNVIAGSIGELQSCIDEFYREGRIRAFDERSGFRKGFVRMKSEHLDGLNGFRTARKIDRFLKKSRPGRRVFAPGLYLNTLIFNIVHYMILYLPFIKRYDFFRSRYRTFPKVLENKRHYQKMIGEFAESKGVV